MKSIECANRAISISAKYDNALTLRGLSYYNTREYKRALADLNRAILLNDKSGSAGSAFYYRARIHLKLEMFNEASRDASRAAKLGRTVPQSVLKAINAGRRKPSESIGTPEVMSSFEQGVRARLADAQLGGVIGFYRRFKDAETVETVRRWDAGVRVSNIDEFERKVVPGKGWQVVSKGTLTKADYSSLTLTTD